MNKNKKVNEDLKKKKKSIKGKLLKYVNAIIIEREKQFYVGLD